MKEYILIQEHYLDIFDALIDIKVPDTFKFKSKKEAERILSSHFHFNLFLTEKGFVGIYEGLDYESINSVLINDYVFRPLNKEKKESIGKSLSLEEIDDFREKYGESALYKLLMSEEYSTSEDDYEEVEVDAIDLYNEAIEKYKPGYEVFLDGEILKAFSCGNQAYRIEENN